jgi:hypothetical protein
MIVRLLTPATWSDQGLGATIARGGRSFGPYSSTQTPRSKYTGLGEGPFPTGDEYPSPVVEIGAGKASPEKVGRVINSTL